MSGIRSITRSASVIGFAAGTSAPFYVNSSTNKVKCIPAGSGTTEVELLQMAASGAVTDPNSTNRVILNPTAKTIVDGSATSLFSVLCPTLDAIGGQIVFLVRASDGTDFQAIAGIATYSAVNKAGTSTATITYVTGNEAKSVSAGTLTLAFTAVDSGSGVITFKLQPTGSLTETTPYTVEYTVLPIRGAVTIL